MNLHNRKKGFWGQMFFIRSGECVYIRYVKVVGLCVFAASLVILKNLTGVMRTKTGCSQEWVFHVNTVCMLGVATLPYSSEGCSALFINWPQTTERTPCSSICVCVYIRWGGNEVRLTDTFLGTLRIWDIWDFIQSFLWWWLFKYLH